MNAMRANGASPSNASPDATAHSTKAVTPEMFPLVDGRVRTRSLEVHIVDHCNLRCWACCSLSPFLPKWFIDPADLERDLNGAKRALAPTCFKLVGGEPLLHPQILECLQIARASGISGIISVTTNGFLLPRMADRFWEMIDAMTISLYPQPALPEPTRRLVEQRAQRHGFQVNWKRQNEFVDMDLVEARVNDAETEMVYANCWLRRRCHILSRGRFYACTRPPHFATLFLDHARFEKDGIPLSEDAGLAERIREYLLRKEPLVACLFCNGGDAPTRPHRQLSADEVRQRIAQSL
jgi:GTP 3',8-cyclase